MKPAKPKERLLALDSLRGLAAFSVMLHHMVLLFPAADMLINHDIASGNRWFNFFAYSPLHAFWCGYEPVVFFFILSGFVLAIPFLDPDFPAVAQYYIKRIFRIYPPYLVAVAVALVASVFLYRGAIPQLSDWFNHQWRSDVDWHLVAKHVMFLGSFDTTRFDGPIWSLVIEMRVSLLFPLLMLLVRNFNWKTVLLVALIPGFIFWLLGFLQTRGLAHIHGNTVTLRHVGFFIIGGLMAKYRGPLVEFGRNLQRRGRIILFFACLCAYTNIWWLHQSGLLSRMGLSWFQENCYLEDLGTAGGVAGFIIIGLASPSVGGLLNSRWLTLLGRVSFSLYLFHIICLFSLLNLFYGKWPMPAILSASIILSLAAALVGYYLVELPSVNFGRFLVSKMKRVSASN